MTDLRAHGLTNAGAVHRNLCPAALLEVAVRRGEGAFASNGAFVAYTAPHTGRSPGDRYLVAEAPSSQQIHWGQVNRPMDPAVFERLLGRALSYLQNRELFLFDGWACADPAHRLSVRVVAEKAWHALFARCLLLRPSTPDELRGFAPALTVLHAAGMHADPARDGTRSEAFIVLALDRGLVLVGGTHYAGEIKKSVFSFLNYLLPARGVFPMHCAANVGPGGDAALFFGLSGTGKTTLSAEPGRRLVGDDEHGWSESGVFNFEGGCYAKTIGLSRAGEPQIWDAIRFGSVLENVPLDPHTRDPDYASDRHTENTRAAYPLEHIDNAAAEARAGHPRNVVFLTCDAFGVVPPLSRLTAEQAMYHFLSGYTAKVAGTERGVTAPQATFSSCFAEPFLPLEPARYAELLERRLREHGPAVWLVNTGWTGGGPGKGSRIRLLYTRAMLRAALAGALEGVPFEPDPTFGVLVPRDCPDVPPEVLQPRQTWADGAKYDRTARQLAALFANNFEQYTARVPPAVREAGPQ